MCSEFATWQTFITQMIKVKNIGTGFTTTVLSTSGLTHFSPLQRPRNDPVKAIKNPDTFHRISRQVASPFEPPHGLIRNSIRRLYLSVTWPENLRAHFRSCSLPPRLNASFSVVIFGAGGETGPAGLCGLNQVRQREKKGGEPLPETAQSGRSWQHGAVTERSGHRLRAGFTFLILFWRGNE